MVGFHRRAVGGLLLGAFAMAAAAQPAPPPWSVPDEAAIRQILADRIDTQKDGVGIVVGVIDARGRRIVSYGARDQGDRRPLDGDTVFEIGSMTKVFTSLLLALAVQKAEAALDQPVQTLLPPGVHVPERNGRRITLIDLATHSSGLPSLPDNFRPKNPKNPYVDYTPEQLWAFLDGYQLTRDPGARYEYSNMGAGLLGQALTRRVGLDYETLVRRRITGPLGMGSTAIALTPAMQARLAAGHGPSLEPASNWDLPTFAGAGALRSTTNDMLTFLAAELGFKATPLKAAMDAQLIPRRPGPTPATEVALAWHITKTRGAQIVWHNGGTGGYRTFMGFDPVAKVGVVVLTNVASARGGDDIGFHLLAGAPLAPPPPPKAAPVARHDLTLPPEALEALVGRYPFAPQAVLEITRDGGQLFVQLTGQPRLPIFAEGPNDFFLKAVDAQLTFLRAADSHVTGVVLHQNGINQTAPRAP